MHDDRITGVTFEENASRNALIVSKEYAWVGNPFSAPEGESIMVLLFCLSGQYKSYYRPRNDTGTRCKRPATVKATNATKTTKATAPTVTAGPDSDHCRCADLQYRYYSPPPIRKESARQYPKLDSTGKPAGAKTSRVSLKIGSHVCCTVSWPDHHPSAWRLPHRRRLSHRGRNAPAA